MTQTSVPLIENRILNPTGAGILWLHQSSLSDQELIGFKAARLGQIERAGFQVPAGFCVPAAVYRQHVLEADASRFWTLLEQQDYTQLRAWIREREIRPEVKQALLAGYHSLQAQAPGGVAVRSSSTAEDLAQHSFAGLYASYLNIKSEAKLLDAVRACWASYWSDEAVAYRERTGVSHISHSMAVLVQAMAPTVLAGVMFTQVSERNPEIGIIEFTREGGEALVSGEAQAKRLYVDRRSGKLVRSRRLEREINITRLLSLGFQLEELLGAPQDVEWVMDAGGNLWILQTRPITSQLYAQLRVQEEIDGEWLLTYDEPFSPLGCEIAIERYRYWVAGINASFKSSFEAEIQNQNGLLYYRPTWRKASRPRKLWMNFWRLVAWLGSARTYQAYVDDILPTYSDRLQSIEQAELADLSASTLMDLLREAIHLYLEFQFTSYAVGAAATLSASLLDEACRFLFGKQTKWNALDFLTGLDDVSIERELEVYRLGQLLKPSLPQPGLDKLSYADLIALQEKNGQETQFWPALEQFLKLYGYMWADRYPRDPAWELNQAVLASSLSIAAQAESEEGLEARHLSQQQRREEAIQQAKTELAQLSRIPGRKFIFSLLLKRAEKLFPYKENRNHYTYRGVMVIRQIAQEIGRRFQCRQLLPAAGDVFFLEVAEIETLWINPKVASWLLQKVEQRKEIYLRSRQLVQQRPPDGEGRAFGEQVEAIEVRGDPCSPGLAKGPARLISGPGELQRVRPGEIIVCTQLRPAWSAVFSRAGGVVIEMGSLLSHGSTLAREYGIPAVINIAGITGLVRENDWLVVDGNLGRVAIERNHSQPAEEQ